MKKVITLLLLLSMCVSSAYAQVTLNDVRVTGNDRVDSATILLQVKSEAGKKYNSDLVEHDIKSIYRLGFFDQVFARLSEATLIFEVRELPSVRSIKLEGNDEVSDESLKEQLKVDSRKFFDRKKFQAAVEQAKAFYQSRGYYGTEIDYEATVVSGNQVDVVFAVKEGEKKVIKEIVFDGSSGLDDDDLDDVISTSTYSWWISWLTGSGVVKQDELAADVQALTQLYLTKGYADVQVSEPVIEEGEKGLAVRYKIVEGPRYSFNNISAEGTLFEGSVEKTLAGTTLKRGDVFNIEALRKDTFTVSEKFTDIGFAFANVEPLTKINRDDRTIDVNYKIDKGEKAKVNRVNIIGNDKTGDNVIRRTLQFDEQETYSSSKIKRSQELLQRLGYFDEVTITPSPTGVPQELDLNVAVKEANTGSFSVGAGISSGDGFIFSTRISENNLFGTGNAVNLDLNTGTKRENYTLSFDNPRVFDSQWSFGVDGLAVERVFDDFDRKQRGGAVTVGYPLWFLGEDYLEDVRFALTYEFLAIDITDVQDSAPQLIKDEEGNSTASTIRPKIIRNTIDNPLDPTKGSRQVFSYETSGLGGDEEYWLIQFNNAWYYPVIPTSAGDIVFSHRVRVGYGGTYNDDKFPLFVRFFPGGIDTVRGYDARELGPKDENGNEFGGDKQFVTNFELLFPLVSEAGLKGLAFFDAGEAFDDEESIDFADLRLAVGWGIRWRSPLAPIRLEIGHPIDKEEGDKTTVVNFSFGAPF